MAEKLSVKALTAELETLRTRVQDLELDFERKLEQALENAAGKLKSRIEDAERQTAAERLRDTLFDPAQRRAMIAEAAYARAERRGFRDGSPEHDWLQAEIEIDRLFLQEWPAGGEALNRQSEGGRSTAHS